MCFNCGCHIPQDNMGSVDNITEDTLKKLAEHWRASVEETKIKLLNLLKDDQIDKDLYLKDMFEKAGKSWG